MFDDFLQRRIDVLVCTTFIEDAPPVVNATAMVVEYADLHSLVRLHRLRGHVGFGRLAGSCTLVLSESPAAGAAEMVQRVAAESDGFQLAEFDLKARGVQALLGDRAAEAPTFAWAEPPEDRALLMRAREEAFRMVRRDPNLSQTPGLAQMVTERCGPWLGQAVPTRPGRVGGGVQGRRRRRRRRK